jgi:hypothetical protein
VSLLAALSPVKRPTADFRPEPPLPDPPARGNVPHLFTVTDMPSPTTHELLSSYHRSLLAKVQLQEFQSWGGNITDRFRETIAAHQELEDRYVAAMIESRAKPQENRGCQPDGYFLHPLGTGRYTYTHPGNAMSSKRWRYVGYAIVGNNHHLPTPIKDKTGEERRESPSRRQDGR